MPGKIIFEPLTLAHLPSIAPYLQEDPSRFCDLTRSNLYMWRNDFATVFCLNEDGLAVRKEYEKGRWAYLFPQGPNPDKMIGDLSALPFSKDQFSFFALTSEQAQKLKERFPHGEINCRPEWEDYLYLASSLRTYAGKKLTGKRHNANAFHRLYPEAKLIKATPEDVPNLLDFLSNYEEENRQRDISFMEDSFARDVISVYPRLNDLVAYYSYNGQIIGLSEGEIVGDTIYIHIEKALRRYEGIYQALTQDFLALFGEGIVYENREEDDGNIGLREAKNQLQPIEKLKKYFFTLRNNIDLYEASPIEGERIDLKLMEEKYAASYFRLASDEKRNAYWGYDYQNDLKGQVASPAYFLHDILNDYAAKACFSYQIVSKKGEYLGEAVLFDFRMDGSGEIGVRLFQEAEGQGYAYEALSLLLALAKQLKLSSIRYESYPENQPSLALAARLGFLNPEPDPATGRLLFQKTLR